MADAKKYQREIVIEDELLVSMVQKKGETVEQGRAITKQMTELQEQINKLMKQLEGLTPKVVNQKVDIFKRLQKLVGKDLAEFEIPITADVREGKVVLTVSDSLTEFKDTFKTFDKFTQPVPVKSLNAKP